MNVSKITFDSIEGNSIDFRGLYAGFDPYPPGSARRGVAVRELVEGTQKPLLRDVAIRIQTMSESSRCPHISQMMSKVDTDGTF